MGPFQVRAHSRDAATAEDEVADAHFMGIGGETGNEGRNWRFCWEFREFHGNGGLSANYAN